MVTHYIVLYAQISSWKIPEYLSTSIEQYNNKINRYSQKKTRMFSNNVRYSRTRHISFSGNMIMYIIKKDTLQPHILTYT